MKKSKKIELNINECKECGLIYKDENTAKKCGDWCRRYKSCNLKITKYAINKNKLQR